MSALYTSPQAFLPAPYAAGPYYNQAPLAYAQQQPIYAAQAPLAFKAAPVVPVQAPLAIPYAPSSQFQAQDEFGNINYGYSNINSQKHEIGNAYGGVTGGYSYVDPNGEVQTVNYIADANGFRVQATNLPVAPDAPIFKQADLPVAPIFTGVAPVAVEKTAEVKEAEAAFFKTFEEVTSRTKRSVALPYGGGYAYGSGYPYAGLGYANAGYAYGHGQGYPYATGFNTPYAYAAPAQVAQTISTLEPVVAKTPASTIKTIPVARTVLSAAPYALNYAAAPALAYAQAPIAAPVAYAHAAPVAYTQAAPVAAEEAILETVKLNPGHAVAYRVY